MNSIFLVILLIVVFMLTIGIEGILTELGNFIFPAQKRLQHEQFNAPLEEEEGLTVVQESEIVNRGKVLNCRITLYDTCFYCNGLLSDYASIAEIVKQKLPLIAYEYTFKFNNQSPSFYTIAISKKNHAEFQRHIDFMVSKNPKIRVGTI